MPTNDTLVTTAEAADVLKLAHRSTVRLVASGELSPERKLPGLRGAYLFRREDVEALAAKRAEAAS